jgi:hypothetical protein
MALPPRYAGNLSPCSGFCVHAVEPPYGIATRACRQSLGRDSDRAAAVLAAINDRIEVIGSSVRAHTAARVGRGVWQIK